MKHFYDVYNERPVALGVDFRRALEELRGVSDDEVNWLLAIN